MTDIQLKLDEHGNGAFVIEENDERLAEMVIRITGTDLIVFHTEVSEKLQGLNMGKELLAAMVSYARQHGLKVIPLCKFVALQFERHTEEYADVWKKLKE